MCPRFVGNSGILCCGGCDQRFHLQCANNAFNHTSADVKAQRSLICDRCASAKSPHTLSSANTATTSRQSISIDMSFVTTQKSPTSLEDIMNMLQSFIGAVTVKITGLQSNLQANVNECVTKIDSLSTSMGEAA